MNKALEQIAQLVRQRNQTEAEITRLTGRAPQIGFVGEFIASHLLDIQLEHPAANKASDGRFRSGPLAGRRVQIKWYGRQEYILDITPSAVPDDYLVMTGPVSGEGSPKGSARAWAIDALYLFDAKEVVRQLTVRKVTLGPATAIPKKWWEAAEIYPNTNSKLLRLTPEQAQQVALFSSANLVKARSG